MEILIQRAKRHDKNAFVELMKHNEQSLYKVAKAILKNDEDVADAMQETIMTCWEKIGTLRKNDYFKTWMTRILINKCNAIYKQRKRFISTDSYLETAISEDGFEIVEWGIFLNELEEKYRIVVILYYVEGFKVREIALLLDITESAVKARLVTARKKLGSFYNVERKCEIV